MRTIKFKNEVEHYEEGSLGQNDLNALAGTKTEQAFINGGQQAWEKYWNNSSIADVGITGLDKFRVEFFTELLGEELYNKITESNDDYPAAYTLHNPYTSWGRANISSFELS